MLSFSWAMPLYGMKQMLDLSMPSDMSRPFGKATDGFEAVTETMKQQLGPTMRSLFQAGDQVQRGLTDVMFSFMNPQAMDPNALMKMGSDLMQRSMQGMGQMAQMAQMGQMGQMMPMMGQMAQMVPGAGAGPGQAPWQRTAP
jgi:hypothetical protein